MKSRYAHIFMVLCAILAFAPLLAIDYLLDDYVRTRETAQLQKVVDGIGADIKTSAYDAVTVLRRVVADSPSICTPTFTNAVRTQLSGSLVTRNVIVEDKDGVQYCDAFGLTVNYRTLSAPLSIPGLSETMQIIMVEGMSVPAIKINQTYGSSRIVSTFAPILPSGIASLTNGLANTTAVRVALTNGFNVASIDPEGLFLDNSGQELITAQGFASEIPIRVLGAERFSTVRANYADLDVSLTVISCLMCAAFLVLMLQYVRRSQLPAFDLERAIAKNHIKPYYQPVINLRTGELAGCEVLCRWEKKNGEVVPPGNFIDYAEMTGLAIPMTLSLMQQVRADLSDIWRDLPHAKISINLFEGHFRDTAIVDDVRNIFADCPIDFRQLVFEITERRPLSNSAQANAVIAGFHALGARLAMDDVGTGHSNLAYIQTLGVDVIKIDRIFVDMVKPDTMQVPVLDGLIAMARDLGAELVAEGVETEAQALYLRARGVTLAQGFLFAPALKAAAFKDLARAMTADAPPASDSAELSAA